jgi:hypothetical protein
MGRQCANGGAGEAPLKYPQELEPFVRQAPVPVLVRSVLEWILQQAMLDRLFDITAQQQ